MDSQKQVLALIQAIDPNSRGSSNLHALVSSLMASSVGSQDALAKSLAVLEPFHQALHKAMLRDDEHAASLATLLQHWYLQGGSHTRACVTQAIPSLAHACLEQLQQGRVPDPTARILLVICNKEIQLRPDHTPFTTPTGQTKRLKPIPPIEEITRFNMSAVLGLVLRRYLQTLQQLGESAAHRFIFLTCAILGNDPSTLPELHRNYKLPTTAELQPPQIDLEDAPEESVATPESKAGTDASETSAPRFKSLLTSLGFMQAEALSHDPSPTAAAAQATTPTTPAKPLTGANGLEPDLDSLPATYRSQYKGFHSLDWLLVQHWLSPSFLQVLQKGLVACLGLLPDRPEYALCLRLIAVIQHAGISKADFAITSGNPLLSLHCAQSQPQAEQEAVSRRIWPNRHEARLHE